MSAHLQKTHQTILIVKYAPCQQDQMVVTMLFLEKYQIDYLQDQYYFNPYPRDLKLRVGL